ncbi:MAG: SdrD B-like domain-containing protein [Halioglobus sp.]
MATPDNSYSTCQGSPVVVAAPGATTVSLTGAVLSPLAVCELRFDVTVSGTNDWVNTIPAGRVTAAGGLTNRDPVSATLFYAAPEVPLISKSITPGTIVPGQSALLTINLTNGSQDLTNLEVVDNFTMDGLPASAKNGMRIAGAPELSTNCPNGIVTALPDGDSVRLSGASMLANTQCQVQVRVTSTTVGTLTNTIPLNSIVSDQGATNSTSFAESTLSTTSAIGVSKLFEPAVVSPTQSARLRVTIYNTQPESVTGLSITDTFPDGLVLAAEPNPFSNCGGGVSVSFPNNVSVMLSGGSLGPALGNEASSCYLETSVVAADEGTYLNVIPENSLRANGTPVTHPPTEAKLEVRKRLIVNKAFDNFTLDANDPAGFTTGVATRLPGVPAPMTIRIENPNTVALTQVNFVDALPDGLVLAQVPAVSTTCTDGQVSGVPSGRDVRLTGATLAATGEAGAVCTVTANVVSNIPGTYTNEIPVGDVRSFEGINNDPGTQAQIIIATTPGVTKDIAPPVIPPNGNATLTIVIENDNALDTVLNTDLVDNLPSSPDQMTVATPSVVSTTCPGGNGIVTAAAGDTAVTVATGAVIPAGGCVVTAQVTAVTPGDYLNYIPVGALNTTFGVSLQPAEAPLKVSTLGYISGRVFLDNQAMPNGQYIPGGSTPINGNPIELRSGGDCSGALLASTSTDGGGNYLFSDLLAGTYSVCQPTQPPNTLNSITLAGSIIPYAGSTGTPGTAANPPGAIPTSQVTAIVLNNNGNANEVSGSPENNFSEVLPVSVAGNVYYDRNLNGVFDPDEAGIGGVTVTLSGPVSASTVTAADGSYSFTDLPPGNYTLVETQPGAWVDAQDTLGTVDGVPTGDASINDTFSNITLAPGDAGIEYNFGETLLDGALTLDAQAYCENNANRVAYSLPDFAAPGAGSAPPVTISWYTAGGRLASQLLDQPPEGVLLWPGTEVDNADMGVGWPGWLFVGGQWEQVADDRIPTMTLLVSVGSTAQVTLQYPPSTVTCQAQPPGTYVPPPPPEPNPPEKIPSTPPGVLWLLSLLLGVTGYLGLRRRSAR